MGPKKFGQKTFWSKKILVEIFFWINNFFWFKNFLGRKKIWVEKNLDKKKLGQKNLLSKKISVKKFGQQTSWIQKKFVLKFVLSQQNYSDKKIWG